MVGLTPAFMNSSPLRRKKAKNLKSRNISAPTPITLPPTVTQPGSPLIDIHPQPDDAHDDTKSISRSAKKWAKHIVAPLSRTASNATSRWRRDSTGRAASQSVLGFSTSNMLGSELAPRGPPLSRPATVFSFRGDPWVNRRRRTDSCVIPSTTRSWDALSSGEDDQKWSHRDLSEPFLPDGELSLLECLDKNLLSKVFKLLSPKSLASLSACSKTLYIAAAPTLFCSISLKPALVPAYGIEDLYAENVRFEVLQAKLKSLCRVSDKTLAVYVKEIKVSGNWIILTDDFSDDEGTESLVGSSKTKGVEELVAELLCFILKRTVGIVSFVWDSVHPIFPRVLSCLSSISSLRHLRLNVRTSMPLNEGMHPLQQNYLPQLYPFNQLYSLVVTNIAPKSTLLGSIFKAISVCPFVRIVCLSGVEDIRVSMSTISSTRTSPLRRDVATQKNYFPTFDWELYRSSKSYDMPSAMSSQAALTLTNNTKKNPYKALLPLTYLGLKNFVLDGKILNLEIDPNTLTHLSLINCYGDGFYIGDEIAQNLRCITTDCFAQQVIQVLPAFLQIGGSYYVEKLMAENLDLLNQAQINPRSTSLLPESSLRVQNRACKDATKKLSFLTNPNADTRGPKHTLTDFLTMISHQPSGSDSVHPLTTLRLPADWALTAQDIRQLFGVNRGEAGELTLYNLNYLSLSIQQSPHAWKNFLLFLPNFFDLVGVHLLTESEPNRPASTFAAEHPSGIPRPKTVYRQPTTHSPVTRARIVEIKRSSRGMRSSLRGFPSERRYLIDDAKEILLAFLDRQRVPTLRWVAVKHAVWEVQRGGGGERVRGEWCLRRVGWEEVGMKCHWGREEGW